MVFSFLSYSQKRILAAGVLSLLVGYMIGVTNTSREMLVVYTHPGPLPVRSIRDSGVSLLGVDGYKMVFINSSMFVGASIGSVVVLGVARFGKVRNMTLAYFFFFIGSLLCLQRKIIICCLGRFICGLGIGISCNTVPSYINELTNKQNQDLFSTLHSVMFCCGILSSYLLCIIVPSSINYIYKSYFFDWKFNYEKIEDALGSYAPFVSLKERHFEITQEENEAFRTLHKEIMCSTLSIRFLFITPLILSLIMTIVWFFKLSEETPLYYIKINNIRIAEKITQQIYGVHDTTKIINQLREEGETEDISVLNLFKTIFKSPKCGIFMFIPIVACTEVFTGLIPLIVNSKILISYLDINYDLSAKYIALIGCFLVIFTLSGVFFELHIGSRRLFLLSLMMILLSLMTICLLLFYSNPKSTLHKPVLVSLIIAISSCGFGVIPTSWKLISTHLTRQFYSSSVPFLYVLFWAISAVSVILIELLPILVTMFIFTCFTMFVLVSFSIMNYQSSEAPIIIS